MMSRGVCARSQGHSTRSTSTMRLSDTSSWPSRASSKAAPGGTVTSVRALDCARAEPAVPRRNSRARRGPCGPASATTTWPAAARPARSSRPSPSAGSISRRRPPPGSASSATRSRSSPSSPAGTKTAPPPASARSEAAGARPAAAPMYTSVRLTALPRGPCERASSARRRRADEARSHGPRGSAVSLTLVYIGAAAGLAPAASLRALAGGGAVFVPAGLDGELRDLVAELADPGGGRLLEIDPADGEGLDDLAGRAAAGQVVVALAGPHGPRLARELRRGTAGSARAQSSALTLVTVPPGAAFDDALLGQELVSLKRIVDVLRVECPWDREQTPRDIIGYTVEEVYELADAVAGDDLAAEHGELGDLLLQVVLLALMLSERGAGDLASVAADIEVKLIRRHPHIFAGGTASTPGEVKSRWERIKVEQEGREGIFHDVPASFPAILQARKLQQRAASVGFDWSSAARCCSLRACSC